MVEGRHIQGFKRYIQEYDGVVRWNWKVYPWFPVDVQKLRDWYNWLETEYSDWKFVYSQHKWMWKSDPADPTGQTGHRFMPDTSWYTLCWNGPERGALPPERGMAKPEYQDEDDDELHPREIFTGYPLDLIQSLPIRSKKWLVTIHTPGTKLITHQDSPDKIRIHIPIYTNENAVWTIDGEEFHMPPGYAYIVNTTVPHSTENKGETDRIHLYGKVWIEDIMDMDI